MARPLSEKHTHRTRRIVFRITESEYLRLSHQAAALDLKLNAYARLLALESNGGVKATPLSSNPALIKQIHHIGHNLNQLVKNAHIFGRISPKVEQLTVRINGLIDKALLGEDNNQ